MHFLRSAQAYESQWGYSGSHFFEYTSEMSYLICYRAATIGRMLHFEAAIIAMETTQQYSFSYKDIFSDGKLFSLVTALLLLGLAYVVEHFANLYELEYSLRPTSTYVGDLLLDNLPVVNLNFIIIEGALFSIVAGVIFVLLRPRYVLFSLKALAILIVIRALAVSLTHVGIYPGNINPGAGIFDGIYTYLNFQTGFFFSGHTALPFLMALIFWEKFRIRVAFLALSCTFAIAVLLAHIHYSIDVLAAPFMAYGVFAIAKRLFPQDYSLIESEHLEKSAR